MKTTIFVIIQVLSLSSTVFADTAQLQAQLQNLNCAELHQVMTTRRAEATQLAKESQPMIKLSPRNQLGLAMQQVAINKIVEADEIESLFTKKCE